MTTNRLLLTSVYVIGLLSQASVYKTVGMGLIKMFTEFITDLQLLISGSLTKVNALRMINIQTIITHSVSNIAI